MFHTLSDEFQQNAFENIRGETVTLKIYAIYKTEIGFEKYLTEIKSPTVRTQLTKYRLSNHNLMIETGRFTNIHKEQRFFPFCPNTVETEIPFCLKCPTYESLRTETLAPIIRTKPTFRSYTEK